MNLEARKISLVKEFLNIDNEKTIRAIEQLLNEMKTTAYEDNLMPMAMAQYKAEIQSAIDDETNGRLIKVKDLKKQIREWD